MNQEILEISKTIRSAVPVEQIYLFGSYAYGEPDADSDFDFFMVIPDTGLKPLDAVRQARFALTSFARTTSVDILADYKNRFDERSKLNTLEKKIRKDGVLLYDSLPNQKTNPRKL
jgi:predicted nucleotidyltransferase